MVLVDRLHQAGIGVILDWVPSHSPDDAHGLGFLMVQSFEHPDRKKGYHPDWKSLVFNYGRNEVRSF
jgi:1,4-alpha-glucan branching enzyme